MDPETLELGTQAIDAMTRCPDCDGAGYWLIRDGGRGLTDGLLSGERIEDCPFCGGSGRRTNERMI